MSIFTDKEVEDLRETFKAFDVNEDVREFLLLDINCCIATFAPLTLNLNSAS